MTATTTAQITTAHADAITRLIGLDTLVDDYEFDADRGHVYHLTDTNVLTVAPDGSLSFTNADGQPTQTGYYYAGDFDGVTFAATDATVEMYQGGIFTGSETI
jgi:hypothetical protein